MPWTETCAMNERMCFVAAYLDGAESISALCREFGISRKTVHKWLARYGESGFVGLEARSRAPLTYVIDGGNFSVNGGATLQEATGGTGVTIILTDSSGGDAPGRVTINGGAIVTLAAPTSGDYSGVVFYQDKSAVSTSKNKFNGGSTTNFTGALYFPK